MLTKEQQEIRDKATDAAIAYGLKSQVIEVLAALSCAVIAVLYGMLVYLTFF